MNAPKGDARTRLPREPYPGLRPFLDFEAALLFGRERQVREVIEHLRESQFVAVLGGSGSGKSSLIMAGVVPELRSFGIAGAGDLWLPMTCTPGTNVSAEDTAAHRVSPVTRLARRFAGLLKSRGSDAADAQRLQEIAGVFRQEAGFARLLDTFGAELAVPPGPDPGEARVLFVLDQFEEIFHPTNKGVDDATLLVERVLDHFFNPHPRCHVVLTMRSEHLNDCAAFLELPDAINKSSYLVRRLDDDELRGAIVGPAQRFLRLMARSQAPDAPRALPPEVRFEPAVLERLLRDVKAITHDPDHLPLLQHLLARLWGAALEREEMDVPVPSHVTEIDLVRAVGGGRAAVAGDEQPLDEKTNTLRACVENWPETLYQWQSEKQRAQLDALFCRLAFKDPNTGMYSQQRVDLDAVAALLGPGKTRVDLRALLAEGFLGSVDYLYWDEEDPTRATLKVSHESFIRGWSRFRALVDRESERFEEFVGVLRRCSAWVASGRTDDLLLESGEMRLLGESGFEARLRAPGQQDDWFRLLQLDRDGARLGRLQGSLDRYLQLSNQRLQARDAATRTRRRWAWASALLLVFLPPAFFSLYIQGPVTQRALLLLDAGTRANRAPLTTAYTGVGAAGVPLVSLLRAAELVDEARSGQSSRMTQLSQWLIEHLSWVPPVRGQGRFLDGLIAQTEPPVNGKLRQLLNGAVWAGAARAPEATAAEMPLMLDVACSPMAGESGQGGPGPAEELQGRLYVAQGRNPDNRQRRALFVQAWTGDADATLTLRGATWNSAESRCRYGEIVVPVPLYLDPHLVLDATLRYVAYTASGHSVDVPSVTVLEIDWDRLEDRSSRVLQTHTRAVVTADPQRPDDAASPLLQVMRAAGNGRVAVVPSWRSSAGRALGLGEGAWQLLSPTALRLPVAADDARFVPLVQAAADSACAKLAPPGSEQAGFPQRFFEHDGRCFHIARGTPEGEGAGGEPASAREPVLVAVYERPVAGGAPARSADNPPAPVASLAPFARLAAGDQEWLVGVQGDYAGWLAVRGPDSSGRQRLLGLPWSTCALWRLGREAHAKAQASDSAVEPRVCIDR